MFVGPHSNVDRHGLPGERHTRIASTATGAAGRRAGPCPASGLRIDANTAHDFFVDGLAAGQVALPFGVTRSNR